jgi:AraC-like DNA-binding protein
VTLVVLEKTATHAAPPVYRETAPEPGLADMVVCTWVDPARPRPQPVLPDACIDLVWDGTTLAIAGPDTHAVPVDRDRTYMGVRFRPGAAPAFLGIGSDEMVDLRVPLRDVWGWQAVELEQRLLERPQDATAVLERALLDRLAVTPDVDPMVGGLVDLLARGTSLPASIDHLGVSDRTLRRRCAIAVGYGPKMLERILRFRRALRLLRNHRSLAETAQLAGYVDQAHLTNESQRLAGLTPAALAARPSLSISTNGFN